MVRDYIILAAGCLVAGVIVTFIILAASVRAGIDLNQNLWLLAIPAVFALTLNIILLELYRKFRKRK